MNHRRLQQWHKASKLFFISIAFLGRSIFTFGQVAIVPVRMNVLYIGVDNPVSVDALGGRDDNITVSVSGGEGVVSKVVTDLYNVRVSSITDECWIKVSVNGKWVGSSSFRVRNLPVPLAAIGGFDSGDTITADRFRIQASVGAYLKDFPFQVKYEVLGFTFNLNDQRGTAKSTDCQGALFSAQAKEYIDQYLKPGTTVTITNIRTKDPGGKELKVAPLIYYVD